MVKPIQDPEEAAKRLMQEAYQRGSADNITTVVVRFLEAQVGTSVSGSAQIYLYQNFQICPIQIDEQKNPEDNFSVFLSMEHQFCQTQVLCLYIPKWFLTVKVEFPAGMFSIVVGVYLLRHLFQKVSCLLGCC